MREIILKHRKVFTIVAFAMLVFIGCFTFPVLNVTRGENFITWYNILIACLAYYEIGSLLRVIYEDKNIGIVALISVGFTLLGYACRYLLEFGEVSNTYNFTLLNVTIHTIVAVVIPTVTALFKQKTA